MKSNIFFPNFVKFFAWICLILTGFLTLTVTNGCKEDAVSPDHGLVLSERNSRTEDHLELLGISCIPDSIYEICDSIPTIDSMVITLPDYPGCSFWIAYEYYNCGDSLHANYYLGNFTVVTHNCSSFSSAFNTAYIAGGATLATFVENFDHDVFLKIKTNMANTFVTPGRYPCNHGAATFVSYIRVSCFKWCYVQVGQTTSSTKISCGSDCCAERTIACRDEGGNLILNTSYDSSYPPHCAGPTIYSSGIPPGRCTSESSCEYTCPN
jgi:hypothetical protein